MKQNFQGIFPALVTPLHEDGTLHVRSLEKLLERVYERSVDGVYLAGSTGEGALLAAAERRKLAEVAVRCSPPDKQVILHVGASSIEETLQLLRHASTLPLAAVSSLPPAGSPTGSLLDFYRRLTTNTDHPFIAYYFPAFTGSELSLEELLELTTIPRIAGVKYTDFDLFKLSLLSERTVVFNGRDEVLAAGLLMGADGGIGSTYNVFPNLYVDLFASASAAKWEDAKKLQQVINRRIAVLLRFPLIPALKECMSWHGISCGPSLSAVRELDPAQRKELQSSLESLQTP
jgi:N-acetylneuraminate lyase